MRELRTAYLDEGRSSTDEVASLRAKHDSTVEERDSVAEDFEHLRQNFDRMVAEHDSLRYELERVRSVPSSSFVAPTLPGPSLDRIRDLERRVDRYQSERSQSWASTQMMRGSRQVRSRLEGEVSSHTAGVEEDSVSKK
ncbi:hypothetical protein AMTR_s00051p00205950 [Amborella trichopoda]|uniref:Uncharacterized protein n=1 Tax=Amborella trichopoda TaxID=13333 RepID=U5D2N9_AMBTC|nr:hypothetical protein AMTR_s00051p00205950 [Amborella trichopoda]